MLQSLGYSEEQLKNEMTDVKGIHYEHCCGKTPVELPTYGIAQEYLTDNWHGMISMLLRDVAPYAAQSATAVKRRETLQAKATVKTWPGNGHLFDPFLKQLAFPLTGA